MTDHWDEFSKSIAEESLPRRETLRRLGIAVTATVLSPLGYAIARGGKPPQQGSGPCKAFCTCQDGVQKTQCLNACKACNNNPSRLAGSCGNYSCCGTGQVSCGDYCADTAHDPYNCGACGRVCDPPGQNEYVDCVAGACAFACYEGASYCEGECTHLDWDPNNCGACGTVCTGPDPHCFSGVCSECDPGQTQCGGSCVDTAWDPINCGVCGNVCGGSTPNCNYGECTECPAGQPKCNGVCTDIYWDSSNCGACGNVCDPIWEYCGAGYCFSTYSQPPTYPYWW